MGVTTGRRVRNWLRFGAAAGAIGVGLAGCGYQPVYGNAGGPRYEVTVGRVATASFEVASEVAAGLRSELSPAGALGQGFPRVVVEVVRVEERSTGAQLVEGTPLARGSEVIVVARAHVVEQLDGPSLRDTGDMSRAAAFASGPTPTADAAARSRALRDAAREVGRALGRALLGLPEPLEG